MPHNTNLFAKIIDWWNLQSEKWGFVTTFSAKRETFKTKQP
jgi:hypothetical protein